MALVFGTNNNVEVKVKSTRTTGVCNGMTAGWAEASLKYGKCDESHKGAIEKAGLLLATRVRLVHNPDKGVQLKGPAWEYMMKAAGLTPALQGSPSCGLLAQHLEGQPGKTLYFVVPCQGGYHAMGARVEANEWDFFDPNKGLERFTSGPDFRQAVTEGCARVQAVLNGNAFVWAVTQ